MTTPDPFAPGYRLTDGNQLNDEIANPVWSVTSSLTATSGGTMLTSAKVVDTITNITNVPTAGAGVTLPQALQGTVLLVVNNGAQDARVFAAGNSTIDGLDGQIGILLAKGTTGLFVAAATKQWEQLSISATTSFNLLTSIATLRILPASPQQAPVYVEGYYYSGDGGGGVFAPGPSVPLANFTGSIGFNGSQLVLTATSFVSGTIYNGMRITGAGIATNLFVSYQISGTTGGIGTYSLVDSLGTSPSIGVASTTMTGIYYTDDGGMTIIPTGGNGTTAWLREGLSVPALNSRTYIKEFNVKWFGAMGNSTDQTISVQNAIYAAGVNGVLYFPSGGYYFSATLNAAVNQVFKGDGPNQTLFWRNSDYGNTIYFANAGAAQISGIWFWHGLPYVGIDTNPSSPTYNTLPYKVTTGAHIRCTNHQNITITDCWLWRMQWGILLDGGSIARIDRCNIQGVWDRYGTGTLSSRQEGLASLVIGLSGYSQLTTVSDCYFGGQPGSPTTITYTSSDTGAHSFYYATTNGGSQNNVWVFNSEGFMLTGCYIGGASYANLAFAPSVAYPLSQVRVHNNFFDSAGADNADISIQCTADGGVVNELAISSNMFNGELYGQYQITSLNPYGSQSVAINSTITGNCIANCNGTPIFIRNWRGGNISTNSISAYNAKNVSAGGDPNFAYGITMFNCVALTVDGNIFGGGVNSDIAGGYTFGSVFNSLSNTNVIEQNSVWNGIGPTALQLGRVDKIYVPVDSNYNIVGYENVVMVIASAPLSVTLPSSIANGFVCTVKDAAGNASINTITIVGTVDGVVNPVINTNYGFKNILYAGAYGWITI